MRTIRVFVDAILAPGREMELDPRAARHVVRVLRRRTGDRIALFDGRGNEAAAEIVRAHRQQGCSVRIDSVSSVDRESPQSLELIQSLAKGDKLDLIVQKATELGVFAIRPVVTGRSEVRPDTADRRLARWREIAINACEQCGRNVVPAIHAPVSLSDLACDSEQRLMLLPGAERSLGGIESVGGRVAVAVGPEGGLDGEDVSRLEEKGFAPVGLGGRILRTETAAIAAIAILQARFGDL